MLYSYNGNHLTKSDPSGNYAYFTDGASPASDVLSDNFSTFTPGTSETKGVGNGQYASLFYLPDVQGNSRGLLNGSQAATDGYNWDAFGTLMSRNGGNPTGYAWGEGSGYQSDNDTGLVLMGHRYYDTRIGRFISQDPVGDGDNWYAYADNDPTDEDDPDGLDAILSLPIGSTPMGSPGYMDGAATGSAGAYDYYTQSQGYWTRGEPTGINIHGQLSNEGGEVETKWIGSNDFNVSFSPFDIEDALTHDLYERFRKAADDQIRLHVENIEIIASSFLPSRGVGPSGEPKIHNPKYKSQKAAREAAAKKSAPGQRPKHDAHPEIGDPHYHPVGEDGKAIKDGVHYGY